ncbi:Uncharacterized protein HZ326_20040 [Fusarium oxysporum f. sp. albedinis]|nr:Uncharacterized protein HZ326_20040 [Fusarium oxysporum f. sp. albedinis]
MFTDPSHLSREYAKALARCKAEECKLTASMGASGAGKTTVLDVLAARKNIGVILGDILIDAMKLRRPSSDLLHMPNSFTSLTRPSASPSVSPPNSASLSLWRSATPISKRSVPFS